MPTYMILGQFTQKGIESIKESPSRLEKVRKEFSDAGGAVKSFFLTMGQYDIVVVVEAPDDATLAKLALNIGSRGTVHTETLRAFTEDEYRKIIGGL